MSNTLLARHLMARLAERKRQGFTLIELLVVVVIIGILASVALPSFLGAQDKARNASVKANVNTVRLALEQYSTDNNGSFPTDANAFTSSGVATAAYLPGGKLPRGPWSTFVQGANLGAGAHLASTTPATSLAAGQLTSVDTLSATTGKVPPSATFDKDTYGVVDYTYSAGDQIYALYGLGKKGQTGIVAGAVSNAGQ